MIEAGAIKNIQKRDGNLCSFINFRKLNGRNVKDAYTLPRTIDTMDIYLGANYFKLGFAQWLLANRDERDGHREDCLYSRRFRLLQM